MTASFDLLTGQLSVQPILRAINHVGALVITQDGQINFEQSYGSAIEPVITNALLTEGGGKLLQENGGLLLL